MAHPPDMPDEGGQRHGGHGGEKVGRRTGQSGQGHTLLGVLEVAHIHRYRLGPAHLGNEHHDQAHRVQVLDGIQGQAPRLLGRGIAKPPCHKSVRQLVERDAQQGSDSADQQRNQAPPVHVLREICK